MHTSKKQIGVFTFRADVENKVLHPEADLKGEMYAGILFVGILSSNFLVVLFGSREIFLSILGYYFVHFLLLNRTSTYKGIELK